MQESEQENGNSNGIVFGDFSITETQTTVLDKEAAPCKLYNDENDENDVKQNKRNHERQKQQAKRAMSETEFTKCFKEKFSLELESQVNCSTPYFDDFLGEAQLEECKTREANIPKT